VELVTVGGGDIEVEVLPRLGARLHRLRVFGHDLLRTPDDAGAHARDPVFWGSYVMAPWCNRIEAGVPVAVGPRRISLSSNFPDGTAIHGQVFTRPWETEGEGSFVIRGGGDGWPWEYEVRQRIAAEGGTLRLDHALTNLSDAPMPAGLGIHPWFRRPLQVAIRGARVHPRNVATIAEPIPVIGAFDLREMRDVPDDLDGCWTDLADPPVKLHWPRVGILATMRVVIGIEPNESMRFRASSLLHVVMASPSHLDAVGVEPQTHAPHGLRRLLNGEPGRLSMLEPGQALGLAVELAFKRAR